MISTLFNLACLFDLSYIKFSLIKILLTMSFINVDQKRIKRKEKKMIKRMKEKKHIIAQLQSYVAQSLLTRVMFTLKTLF